MSRQKTYNFSLNFTEHGQTHAKFPSPWHDFKIQAITRCVSRCENLGCLVQGMVTTPYPSHYPKTDYSTPFGTAAHQSDMELLGTFRVNYRKQMNGPKDKRLWIFVFVTGKELLSVNWNICLDFGFETYFNKTFYKGWPWRLFQNRNRCIQSVCSVNFRNAS